MASVADPALTRLPPLPPTAPRRAPPSPTRGEGVVGFIVALLLSLLALPAHAQSFPPLTGLVVDAAHVLPAQTQASLTAKLASLQQQTGRQLVVATIPDLQGYDLSDYGYRLGRAWGIGLKGVNNGAILFIAPNEPKGHRGPRIEVGYGLEGTITDALSWQIIHDDMMPRLNGDHDIPGAMEAGTDALIAQLRLPDDQSKARLDAAAREFNKAHQRGNGGGGLPLGLIFWLVLIAAFLGLRWFGRGRGQTAYRGGSGNSMGGGGSNWPIWLWAASEFMGDRHRGGGGGFFDGGGSGGGGGPDGSWTGGGFTGGGGGSFGGGGASGDW